MERPSSPKAKGASVPREYRSLMAFIVLLVFISGFPQLYYAAAMMIAVTVHYFRMGGTPDAFAEVTLPWLEGNRQSFEAAQRQALWADD